MDPKLEPKIETAGPNLGDSERRNGPKIGTENKCFGGAINSAGFRRLAVVELCCTPGAARIGRPSNQHGRDVRVSLARRWEGGGAM